MQALPPRAPANDAQFLDVSIGALSRVPGDGTTVNAPLHAGDEALDAAMRDGRNRVRTARVMLPYPPACGLRAPLKHDRHRADIR